MQITQVNIRTANEHLVKAYVDIVFDNCFMIEEIRIIKGPRGLFISFPTNNLSDGTHWDIAFPLNAQTRRMIQQAILGQYEKHCGKRESEDQLRVTAQLST
jgi:stage V sporulation protein G